jgi:hypothetical protein
MVDLEERPHWLPLGTGRRVDIVWCWIKFDRMIDILP